jgi:Tol biopolymer transport system component
MNDQAKESNMDNPGTTRHIRAKQLSIRKKLILGLTAIGLITLTSLACAVYLAFTYITRNIEATPLTLPLSADKAVHNQIAFVGNDDNLWLVSPDGQNLHSVTSDGRGYRFPTWSPDGRRLAFIGPGETDTTVLYISPANRSDPVAVFNDPESAPFYLYWAPDSNSITFLTQELSGLAMRMIDTRTPQGDRVLAKGAPFYWVWSPQSDKMLLHVGGSRAASEQAHISILENHQDAERVELALPPGKFQAPVWSSDGNHIFYIAADNQGKEAIYKTNAETLEQMVVTNLDGFAYIVLSPDNRHVAYLQIERGSRPPFGKAYLVGTDGQNHHLLMENPVASMYWSPDGTKLALLSLTRANEGPTAKIDGLAAPLPQKVQLRWWIYYVETEELEPLFSFSPTIEFLQLVPYFDQYHLSLTFWSPDSRYLVVTEEKSDNHHGTVWVVDTTGQEEPRQVGEGTLAVWSWQ